MESATSIYAIAAGVVSAVDYQAGGDSAGAGNYVIVNRLTIREDNQEESDFYAHLAEVFVRENQGVDEGSLIGTMGNTGAPKNGRMGKHLHWSFRLNGVKARYDDPEGAMRLAFGCECRITSGFDDPRGNRIHSGYDGVPCGSKGMQ